MHSATVETRPRGSAPPGGGEILLLVGSGWGVRAFLQSSVLEHLRKHAPVRVLAAEPLVPALRQELGGAVELEALRPYEPRASGAGRIYRRRNAHFQRLATTATRRFKADRHRRTLRGRAALLHRLRALDAALRASPRTFERLWDAEERRFFDESPLAVEYAELFRRHPPSLVVSTTPLAPGEAPPVRVAWRMGIPTAAWITSWDNLTSKPAFYARYDHYFVWSQRMCQELRAYYPESAAAPCTAVGVPHFDAYRDPAMRGERETFFRELGLDPGRPLILYAAATPHLAPAEHLTIERLAGDLAGRSAERRPQLLVRLHPGDAGGRLRRWSPPADVRLRIPGARGDGKLDRYCPTREETRELANSILHADVVVNLASTITLEAALCDRPVVNVAYDLSPGAPYQERIDAYYHRFEHYRTVTESGAVRLARSPEELLRHVDTYLLHPELEREERRRIVELWCGPTDGRSGERLATRLLELAGGRKRKKTDRRSTPGETLDSTRSDRNDCAPVFVVGHPRSGTTLVQMILAAHRDLFSAPETHYFRYALEPLRDWVDRAFSRHEVSMVVGRLRAKKVPVGERVEAELRRRAANGDLRAAEVLDTVMCSLRPKSGPGGARWIEKTPEHAAHARQILHLFPRAKIIHVVRDPRDVVSSVLRLRSPAQFGRRRRLYIAAWARRWNRIVRRLLDLQRNGEEVLTIRYEDLIRAPEKCVHGMSRFLGIPFDPTVLGRFSTEYEGVVTPQETWKSLCATNRLLDRRGVWRQRLQDLDVGVVEVVCGRLMRRFGYQRSEPHSRRRILLALTLAGDWTLANWRRLPVALPGLLK